MKRVSDLFFDRMLKAFAIVFITIDALAVVAAIGMMYWLWATGA